MARDSRSVVGLEVPRFPLTSEIFKVDSPQSWVLSPRNWRNSSPTRRTRQPSATASLKRRYSWVGFNSLNVIVVSFGASIFVLYLSSVNIKSLSPFWFSYGTLAPTKLVLLNQQRFRSQHHNTIVYCELVTLWTATSKLIVLTNYPNTVHLFR